MKAELEQRLAALRQKLKLHSLDGLLVQSRVSSLYLSGFPCSNSLILITRKHGIFFTDSRYIVKATAEIKHLEVVQIVQRALDTVARTVKKLRIKRLGFEESISFGEYQALCNAFGSIADLKPAGGLVKDLRLVKSATEIRQIAANQKLNEQLFQEAVESVSASDSETTIRNGILHKMVDAGCAEAFHSIIAAGNNSALPHAVPGSQRVKKNSFLLFDMGVLHNHYHSDMTRTVAVGERLPARLKEIYQITLEAQQAAINAVAPGKTCSEIDSVARDIISKAGYADYFGHGLGHGVGLEIHEGPTLNPRSKDVLKPGMVITIEPGIYLPGLGGVRIEDLLVVTEKGFRNLTSVAKELRFLTI